MGMLFIFSIIFSVFAASTVTTKQIWKQLHNSCHLSLLAHVVCWWGGNELLLSDLWAGQGSALGKTLSCLGPTRAQGSGEGAQLPQNLWAIRSYWDALVQIIKSMFSSSNSEVMYCHSNIWFHVIQLFLTNTFYLMNFVLLLLFGSYLENIVPGMEVSY